jgi:predicted HTH domain antitoxin
MSKVNIEIELPERIHGTDLEKMLMEKARKHALEQAVVELYREGQITTGTGAELLDMPLYDFIRFLGQHQLSVFGYTEDELEEDAQAAGVVNDSLKRNKLNERR